MGEKIKTLVVMGEETMEMEYIKHALIASHVEFIFAEDGMGLVNSSTAYSCSVESIEVAARKFNSEQVVFVGCKPFQIWEGSCEFIDHGMGVNELGYLNSRYWFSSSICKVMEWLFANTTDAKELMSNLYLAGYDGDVAELIAAASYNLIDAYKGSVLQVSPEDILVRRAGFIARRNDCSQGDVMLKIDDSKSIIESAPKIDLCGTSVADLRGLEISDFLSEASAVIGWPFISSEVENNHTKVSINSASVEQIDSFGRVFAQEMGLSNVTKRPESYQAFGFM